MDNVDPAGRQKATSVNYTEERILAIKYWSPKVLSFRTTRYAGFRFTAGHYARLGLPMAAEQGSWVTRPYSIVSPVWADYLEFLSVLIPDGAFSQQLANAQIGDTIRIEKPAYGFLTVDRLAPGADLWLIASGTGIGSFLSILQEPSIWQQYQRLMLVHSVRQSDELAYRDEILALPQQQSLRDGGAQLHYLPIATRESGATLFANRIPELLADGRLEQALAPIDVAYSRLMICGNPEMAAEMRRQLQIRGFATTRRGVAGQMAFEQYW